MTVGALQPTLPLPLLSVVPSIARSQCANRAICGCILLCTCRLALSWLVTCAPYTYAEKALTRILCMREGLHRSQEAVDHGDFEYAAARRAGTSVARASLSPLPGAVSVGSILPRSSRLDTDLQGARETDRILDFRARHPFRKFHKPTGRATCRMRMLQPDEAVAAASMQTPGAAARCGDRLRAWKHV